MMPFEFGNMTLTESNGVRVRGNSSLWSGVGACPDITSLAGGTEGSVGVGWTM